MNETDILIPTPAQRADKISAYFDRIKEISSLRTQYGIYIKKMLDEAFQEVLKLAKEAKNE